MSVYFADLNISKNDIDKQFCNNVQCFNVECMQTHDESAECNSQGDLVYAVKNANSCLNANVSEKQILVSENVCNKNSSLNFHSPIINVENVNITEISGNHQQTSDNNNLHNHILLVVCE